MAGVLLTLYSEPSALADEPGWWHGLGKSGRETKINEADRADERKDADERVHGRGAASCGYVLSQISTAVIQSFSVVSICSVKIRSVSGRQFACENQCLAVDAHVLRARGCFGSNQLLPIIRTYNLNPTS